MQTFEPYLSRIHPCTDLVQNDRKKKDILKLKYVWDLMTVVILKIDNNLQSLKVKT